MHRAGRPLNDDGTPKLDAAGNPITTPAPPPPPPPCVPAKHVKCPKLKKKKKEKPPKVEPANISRGIFTVDGIIGKAALNYSIPDLKFIYFYAPGIGAVVISDNRFPGAVEQKNAFNGHTLTVTVAGNHVMQLYSDDILLSKRSTAGKVSKENKKAGSAFIIYNSSFTLPTRFPVVGYGNKPDPPYSWPGSNERHHQGHRSRRAACTRCADAHAHSESLPGRAGAYQRAAPAAEGWLSAAAHTQGHAAAEVRSAQGRAAGAGEVHPARPAAALLKSSRELVLKGVALATP